MSIDTQEQALAEARKRWGLDAWCDYIEPFTPGDSPCCEVGTLHKLKGSGKTYDVAFADADKREGK